MSKLIKLATVHIALLALLTSCDAGTSNSVSIIQSENGAAKVRVVDWDEGFELFAESKAPSNENIKIMESAVCKNVTVFWAGESTLVVIYDKLEATYFNGSYIDGSHLDICRRGTSRCPPEPTSALSIMGCNR